MGAIASCASSSQNLESSDPSQSPTTSAEQSIGEETPSEEVSPEAPATEEPEAEATAQSNLETYDETPAGIPVTAQYPADTMEAMGTGSGEGVGVFFTFKPTGTHMDEAEVHIFLPSGTASAAELESFVTGADGLIAANGWIPGDAENIADSPYADDFSYPWVERVIPFSTDMEESGVILLGQTDDQAVQVTLFYPAEMVDAYWPSAKNILDSLAFDAGLLPLTSSEGL